jgi:hypothetical protein
MPVSYYFIDSVGNAIEIEVIKKATELFCSIKKEKNWHLLYSALEYTMCGKSKTLEELCVGMNEYFAEYIDFLKKECNLAGFSAGRC